MLTTQTAASLIGVPRCRVPPARQHLNSVPRLILRSRYVLGGVSFSLVIYFVMGPAGRVSDGWIISAGLAAPVLATASLLLRARHFAPTLEVAIGLALGSSTAIAVTANLDQDLEGVGDRVAIGFAMLLVHNSAIWITFVGVRFLRLVLTRHP